MINTTALQGPYVFISYPRSEVVFVKRLVEDLRAHGFQAWLDKTNIDPGSPDWETAIRDAVRNAHAILLIASPRVTKSLYIKGELNLAKRYHPNHIYPIWMDGTEWSDCVPLDFINTQYIDMRGESYALGLDTLIQVLGKERARSSLNTATPQAPIPGSSPTPVLDTPTPTYTAGPGGQLSEPNTGVEPQPHASATTQAPQVTATTSAQTPQALYAQVTQGPPTLNDPLSTNDANNWTEMTSADGKFSCAFSGGVYHVSAPFMPCLAQARNFGDLAYQVQMTIVKGEFGGIVFRVDSSQTKYYTFYIDRYGTYTLKTSVDNTGNRDYVLGTGTSARFRTGLNQANLLTVIARGSNIYLYINQHFITRASDTTYRAGQIGVFGGNSSQAPADVVFSHAQVWNV